MGHEFGWILTLKGAIAPFDPGVSFDVDCPTSTTCEFPLGLRSVRYAVPKPGRFEREQATH